MKWDDAPLLTPSDRLGRMLVVSMLLHLAIVGVVLLVQPRGAKVGLTPSYTVDLVDFPGLPGAAPGPQETAPGPSGPPPAVERGPTPPLGRPEGRITAAPVKPVKKVETPPVTATPARPLPKPPPAAKPPIAAPPEPVRQPTTPTRTAKPKPQPAPPAPTAAEKSRGREREISQALQASQEKTRQAVREENIREAVQGVEKGLAAKSRDQAYKQAVGEAAARLSAGKVSAKLAGKSARGGGGGGQAGGGSAGGGLSLAYGQRVARLIRGNWQPNCLQRSNLKGLKAVIVVRVAGDGSITASWFEHESGDRLYDQAAMAAVTRTNPLPPLPAGQEQLEIGITFTPEWKTSS